MAFSRGHAWLTNVVTDNDIPSSLVLAESLLRTLTTKRIGVIITENVSFAGRLALHKTFHDVFIMDEILIPQYKSTQLSSDMKSNDETNLRAKIFAFSLEMYEKCVFMDHNTLVLENLDELFKENVAGYSNIGHYHNEKLYKYADHFIFQPSKALFEYLVWQIKNLECTEFASDDFLRSKTRDWMANNFSSSNISNNFPQCLIPAVILSMSTGCVKLQSTCTMSPKMARFHDVPLGGDLLGAFQGLMGFKALEKSILARKIAETWMEMYYSSSAGNTALNKLPMLSNATKSNYKTEPVAIIGMSCRFPGANNVEEFWKLLYSGEEGIREPPAFRWTKQHSIFGGSGKERKTNAGFLSAPVDEFDSKFFGVSPKEAVFLDPQARLLHEVLWESLENGGIDPLKLRGTHTGIFTGSWMNDYKDIVQTSTERDFFRTYMGNSMGATAARLSFLLGLTGPSIATESGCSSAIVAVDLAVKSLRAGESNLAIAGGVNLLLHPFQSNVIDFVVAPNGRCKTFDEKADGFGRAEGCGVLVLKRLSDALRDRDNIWAMIRGSAISQEGLSRSLGTPTVHCEALAMELALKDAGVLPEQVSFVETHGTGTSIGDPMECAAIGKAYNTEARTEPLIIGSVKTNVGHTESCSGITGIIKTVLAMQHELIPKHLNLDNLNPEVNLDAIPAKIPMEPIPWPKVDGHPRIAGVSSFGITGTDGHVIVQEAPDYELTKFTLGLERPIHLMKFSAKTKEALDEMQKLYEDLFRKNSANENDEMFCDAAFTANTGRSSFGHRAFLMGKSYEDAAEAIHSNKLVRADVTGNEPGTICFLFTGQGSQYTGMAHSLYETSPVFRVCFDQCDRILRKTYNLSILDVLWESDAKSKELSRTIYSQTSIFCVEYCLLKLWESWGIKPDYVLGHSLGEFCAAVAAGIFSFEGALKLIVERSRLIDKLPQGSMLVIKSSLQEVEELMTKSDVDLDIAAINSSEQTVVAGDTEKVMNFLDICRKHDIKAIVLEASHAFHSRHMDPMLEEYRKTAATVRSSKGSESCKYISGMEGKLVEDPSSAIDAEYWVKHTREKVLFLEACKALKEVECGSFVEIGPQPVLSSFVMQNIEDFPVTCFPSLRRNADDWESMLTSLGKLYLHGFVIDWEGFDKPYLRKKVPTSLPFHPMKRKSFWVDCSETSIAPIHPLLGTPFKNASNLSLFHNTLNLKSLPYLRDHCIGNRVVLPGAAFTEMCMSAGYCVSNALTDLVDKPRRPISLEDLKIELPLELAEGINCHIQVIVNQNHNDLRSDFTDTHRQGFHTKVFRKSNNDVATAGPWALHSCATVYPFANTKEILSKLDTNIVQTLLENEILPTNTFYKRIYGVGIKFGEKFRSLQRYWARESDNQKDEIVAEMKVPKDNSSYLLHPIIIDAMFQARILTQRQTQNEVLSVPVRIGKLAWLDNIVENSDVLYIYARWEDEKNCCIFTLNQDLSPVAFMSHVEFIETNVRTIESILEQQTRIYPDSWEEVWKPISGPHDEQIQLSTLKPIFSEDINLSLKLAAIEKCATPEHEENYHKMNRLVYMYILRALFKLEWVPLTGEMITVEKFCEKHKILPRFNQLVRFYFCMLEKERGIIGLRQTGKNSWVICHVMLSCNEKVISESELLFDQLKLKSSISVIVNIYRKIATHLPEILLGEMSVMSILFPNELSSPENQQYSAETYYQHHPGRSEGLSKAVETVRSIWRHMKSLNTSDNALTTKKVYRVLEVGAGTGSISIAMADVLSEVWGDEFEYYFTDISPSFIAKAEKRLEESKGSFKFLAFNIEEPPLEQGIPLNYFDIVLASDVLHATKNLKQCLQNLRQTLRPQGSIFFTDTLTQDPGITFVFGLLDGFWIFEDFHLRPYHINVDGETWRKLLLESGFEFVHISKAYMGIIGCITAEASCTNGYDHVRNDNMPTGNKKWILFSPGTTNEVRKITTVINSSGCGVTVVLPSPEMEEDDEKIASGIQSAFSTGEIQGVIYAWGMDKDVYDQRRIARPFMHLAQHILNMKKPPKIYVLTRGVHAITESQMDFNPSAATLFGMIKSLKNESSDLFVRYVDLDRQSDLNLLIEQILFELAMNKEIKERERVQVAYRNGSRYEPRFNRSTLPQNPTREDLKLPPSTERFKLVLPKSRMINDLDFDVLEEATLGENEVEVATKAYALNFRDIFAVLKPIKEFENLNAVGLDFAGVVTKVGNKVAPEVAKVGDRVCGVNMNEVQLPSHLILKAECVLQMPKEMTYAEACTLPAVFATSYHCLINIAKMKEGDTVLIHTGSGGVGLSAIQLAKHIGAKIISTAGNPQKRAYLRSLGIEHVFHSRDTLYKEEIMTVTGGKGVDIILNSLTGPGFKEASLSVCAKNARFIEMSKLAIWTEEEVRELRPDVKYAIVDLSVTEASEWNKLLESMKELLGERHVSPIPYVMFDALRIRQALQYFQKAKHIGKVVVTMPEIKAVDGQWEVNVPRFNGESIYLITGGLGGIGFEVCKWMLTKGATDIILIGRNPPKPDVFKEIERLNNETNRNVIIKLGDVGNFDECKAIIADVKQNYPKPIRGVHHCAGVLRDELLAKQTWTFFEEGFNPKVEGTWNLHKLTMNMPLEHFVLYSSISALIGTPTQAIHAAANCFEDAFAHYRHSLGLPAATINWGQWAEVGVAKDITLHGLIPLSVTRMLNGLEAAFRCQKTQVTFAEFESFEKLAIICPMIKNYLDDRLCHSTKTEHKQILLKSVQFWHDMDEAETKDEKLDVMTQYLKIIVREALRMDPDEQISVDSNMQELGVDSLMLIEMKNNIQNVVGSRLTITANMLKDCNTIRDLATVVVNKICDDDENIKIPSLSPEELASLLEGDCVLDESIHANFPASEVTTEMKTAFLTGVTGQLGPYILSTLCQPAYQTVEKIICLIRTKEEWCPREKLQTILENMSLLEKVDMSKVECFRGDVTQPKFGLSDKDYEELCSSVDCVIHLACNSSHVEMYRNCEKGTKDIRSVNVGGTVNALRFAATGKTKQVYYSSGLISIFGGNDEGTLSDGWPDQSQIRVIVDNNIVGYPASKYVCEILLKQANERGIPCKVFRFPWILGDSVTGKLNYMNNHYILRFLSYLKIKSMPMAPLPAVLLPVDICADLSLQIFWNKDAPFEVYNITHPKPELEVEFVKIAKQDFGIELELVEWKSKEFAEKLYASDMPLESLREIYEDVDRAIEIATSDAFKAIQGYLKSPENFFENRKVEKFTPDYSKRILSTMDIIRKNLAYVKSKGFFDKFGIHC